MLLDMILQHAQSSINISVTGCTKWKTKDSLHKRFQSTVAVRFRLCHTLNINSFKWVLIVFSMLVKYSWDLKQCYTVYLTTTVLFYLTNDPLREPVPDASWRKWPWKAGSEVTFEMLDAVHFIRECQGRHHCEREIKLQGTGKSVTITKCMVATNV